MTTQKTTNPATNNLPDSWKNRIQNASVFLGITPEIIEEKLKALGVEKEPAGMEMLSDETITPFGDLRKVFGDDMGVPIAKLRMAMKYLRGPKDSKKTDTISPEFIKINEKYGVKLRLENVPTDQLLEDYDPKNIHSPITITLKKRYGDTPVIVFKPDSVIVDIETTANYIADLDTGYAEEDVIESEGKLVKIYKVGEMPNQTVDEDPLFEGSPLKNGRSIVNRVNWNKVSKEARQFIRIAIEMNEINTDNKREVRETLKDAVEGIDKLAEIYPEVDLEYRERKTKQELPNLVMSLEDATAERTQNPFNIGRNRRV